VSKTNPFSLYDDEESLADKGLTKEDVIKAYNEIMKQVKNLTSIMTKWQKKTGSDETDSRSAIAGAIG
jgi:prolyl-tRNA synthetase